MPELQATWLPDGRLFFWATDNDIVAVAENELPGLSRANGAVGFQSLALSGEQLKRRRTRGVEMSIADAIGVLASVKQDSPVTDSVRCWSGATKLALKLAASQQVVPTVKGQEARWRALLTAKQDRDIFERLCRSLPTAARALPSRPRDA